MTGFFRRLSISRKLIVISATPIVIITLILVIVSGSLELGQKRIELIERSDTLTRILADNIGAAVLFEDKPNVLKVLQTLSSGRNNVFAQAVSSRSALKVELPLNNEQTNFRDILSDPNCRPENFSIFSVYLVTIQPIIIDQENIGELTLITDTSSLQSVVIENLLILLVISLITSFGVYLLIRRFHKDIEEPLKSLQVTMQNVSRKGDYQFDLEKQDDPLLQDLFAGFQNMLDQISDREKQLTAHRKQAEKQVELRLNEIEIINRKRIFWLENMAYFLHHELKNKVIGYSSTLDLIERKTGQNSDVEKYLTRARKAIVMMDQLLKGISIASDFEANLWSESKSVINFSELLRGQLEDYQSQYPEALFESILKPNVKIQANAPRLIQAIDKLVSNAIEHSTPETPIKIKLIQNNLMAELEIINLGDPLPDSLASIFNLFVSNSSAEENRGLGLYVVSQIIENHAGDIEVNSLENPSGASFTIKIPLYES